MKAPPPPPTSRAPAPQVTGPASSQVTAAWRAPLIGALLIPPSAFCAAYAYLVVQATQWGQQSLKLGPVCFLFVLVGLNGLLRLARRVRILTPGELALIYSMLVVATAIGGVGMVEFHITGLPVPYCREFKDVEKLRPLAPWYLSPSDPDVAAQFFHGSATFYSLRVIAAWAVPALFWSGFLLLLFWVMLCINALVRRQWIEGERLTFPLVQLPLEMVREGDGFWNSRLMWSGFALAGALESIDSINFLYPAFPYVPIKPIRLDLLLGGAPWNSLGMVALAFYPFAIGIAYLLTLDVSFGCWFFYLLTKAELWLATAYGWKETGGPALGRAPYLDEQSAGAFIGLALFALWTARRPLAAAWRAALRGAPRLPGELMSARLAWIGAIGGMLAAAWLFDQLGLHFWIALTFFILYFLFQITLTRIVAEAGAGWHFGPNFNAHQILFGAVGIKGFGPRGLAMLAYLQWIDLDYRDTPMPHQLEAMKLAQGTGTRLPRVLWALLLAGAVGALSAYWAHLQVYYDYGAASAKVRPWLTSVGQAPWRQLRDWLANPRPPNFTGLQAGAAGLMVVTLLGLARQRLVWWPFHPIGYALGNTASMDYMWLPFLIAWVLKAGVLRYGGMPLYRRSVPFFLGLILGDYVIPGLWFLFGALTHTQMYLSFPH